MEFNKMTLGEKRNYLIEKLANGICTVEFTKINGEKRIMPCTLTSNLLPPSPIRENTEKKERKVNTDTLRVFVTDINEWRSFRIDSVISIT
jgi:hypothetical protein